MTDKVRVGIITSVTPRAICYDNQSNNCTWIALTGDDGRAVLDAKGQIQQDPAAVFVDVEKWLGHETWNAPSPLDPTHLTLYWVRDHEQLIQFTMGRRDASVHPGVLRLERDSPPTRIQKIRS